MPITFKSRHAPNIIMFEGVALELIKLMGHSGTVPGSLAAEDVGSALLRLEAALTEAPSATLEADRPAEDEGSDDKSDTVSAAHRAGPLLDMLRSALADGDYVIWDR